MNIDAGIVIAFVAILIALLIGHIQVHESSKNMQISAIGTVLMSGQQAISGLSEIKDDDDDDHDLAISQFLNSLEYYAMLVNAEYIKKKDLRKFVELDYLEVYDFFIANNPKYNEDGTRYSEMKKLYRRIIEEKRYKNYTKWKIKHSVK